MYSSLIPWITVPYEYKPFVKYTGAGVKQYGDTVKSLCYPSGDVRRITNLDGVEVTSTARLYVPGDEPIKASDTVIFEGLERSIIRITSFYINGKVDIKVVYL